MRKEFYSALASLGLFLEGCRVVQPEGASQSFKPYESANFSIHRLGSNSFGSR